MKARVRHLITLAFVLMFVLIVALIASIGNSSRSMLTFDIAPSAAEST